MIKSNKKMLLIAVLLGGAIGLTNCKSTATPTTANDGNKVVVVNSNQANTTGENVNNKPANVVAENTANKANKTTTNSDVAKTKTSSGGKIGVPECDDYIEKYEICLNTKIPEAQRETYRKTLETTRIGLKKAVTIPQAKAVLGISCNESLQTAKEVMSAFSCDW